MNAVFLEALICGELDAAGQVTASTHDLVELVALTLISLNNLVSLVNLVSDSITLHLLPH